MYTVYMFCIPIMLVIFVTHWRESRYQVRKRRFGDTTSSCMIIFKQLT